MTNGTLTIIQLELETKLIQGLEKVATELHCPRDDLINEALRLFVYGQERVENLKAQEAKRQSLLASNEKNPDADFWLKQNEESWLDEWK